MITDKIIESNSGVVSLKGVLTDSNLAPKSTKEHLKLNWLF